MNDKVNKMLTDKKLKKLVSLMVENKIQLLKEGKKLQAIRSLTIEAQQAAMKFEENMLDSLDTMNPDEMEDEYQQIYSQAMADFHSKFIEAVVHAANILKDLPTKPKEATSQRKKEKTNSEISEKSTSEISSYENQ